MLFAGDRGGKIRFTLNATTGRAAQPHRAEHLSVQGAGDALRESSTTGGRI